MTDETPDRDGDGALPTRDRLVAAATREFAEHGFFGTDSNKIARRAGFAPQTFYRWFRDKTAIFIAVYRSWEDEERAVIDGLVAANAKPRRIAEASVAHHRAHLTFRRSLRRLALEDEAVRAARTASRLRQLEQIKRWTGPNVAPTEVIAAVLLEIERLCDAVAEGEFADLGLGDDVGYAAIADRIKRLRR